jgi:hypothetical protein
MTINCFLRTVAIVVLVLVAIVTVNALIDTGWSWMVVAPVAVVAAAAICALTHGRRMRPAAGRS